MFNLFPASRGEAGCQSYGFIPPAYPLSSPLQPKKKPPALDCRLLFLPWNLSGSIKCSGSGSGYQSYTPLNKILLKKQNKRFLGINGLNISPFSVQYPGLQYTVIVKVFFSKDGMIFQRFGMRRFNSGKQCCNNSEPVLRIRIRIHQIHMFLGLLDPDPNPVVRWMNPGSTPKCHGSATLFRTVKACKRGKRGKYVLFSEVIPSVDREPVG